MKTKSEGADPRASTGCRREDLELAQEIHALTQLVYGQLVATCPWVAATPRNLLQGPIGYPISMPGPVPNPWSVPAVWPCCP